MIHNLQLTYTPSNEAEQAVARARFESALTVDFGRSVLSSLNMKHATSYTISLKHYEDKGLHNELIIGAEWHIDPNYPLPRAEPPGLEPLD